MTGAGTNVIRGMAVGMESVATCLLLVAGVAIIANVFMGALGLYGIALAAVGMLGGTAIVMTVDAYGPISDNAGGIAEMAGLPPAVREITDELDAVGNTTAAIGKGFAIGSATLTVVALFSAYSLEVNHAREIYDRTATAKLGPMDLALDNPGILIGILVGAVMPFIVSASTMLAVGKAAGAIVLEIKRQFDLNPNLLIPNHPDRPDYDKCIAISTEASLSEMVPPAILVMFSPIICGVFFGTRCVTGLLAGGIASGVQMAISSSNTGGAWDNAKKYISKGAMNDVIAREEPDMVKNGKVLTKKSQIFKAAVTGDTVGDPLKDTSGPALNILMKLMAIISVVFAPLFLAINNGGGLIASTGIVAIPGSTAAFTTTLLANGATAGAIATPMGNMFAAVLFLTGAAVGMGGLFIGQRIKDPPVLVMRESLKKPLLMCRAESVEGTILGEPALTTPYTAFGSA
jgi:H(+)-translocating pyrophosphatase